ncbi:MAG TPA: type II toxin-antitoxin system VapC family toxin [Rhizomicrobium sp.]|jgi:predicted nucleic-acid-binding protein|nr:type II toxin-antitoxin system VapC family toxin [Rhizomicrobium sp.]
MRGLDTNVLLRFLLADDRRQFVAAKAAIAHAISAGEPLLVSLLAILETEWVLRSSAGLAKTEILRIFKKLLESGDLAFESEVVIEDALVRFEKSNADFAECLMMAHYQHLGCSAMLTFDVKASKMPGVELLSA